MSSFRKYAAALATCLLLLTVPHHEARASEFFIPDSDTALLAAISANMFVMVQNIQESIQVTRESLGYLRQGLRATSMVRSAAEDPEGFMVAEAKHFAEVYDIYGIAEEAEALRRDLKGMNGVDGSYDPYQFRNILGQLKYGAERGKFSTVTRVLDVWGLHDPHDKLIERVGQLKNDAAAHLTDVQTAAFGLGMSEKEAAVNTALATANTSYVETENLRIQQEMLMIKQIETMQRVQAENEAQIEKMEQTTLHAAPDSWELETNTSIGLE